MPCVCASNRSLRNLSDLNAWSYRCQASPLRICQKEKTSGCKIIKRWIARSSIHAQSICQVIIVRLYPRWLLSVVRLLVIYDICVYKRAFMENDYRFAIENSWKSTTGMMEWDTNWLAAYHLLHDFYPWMSFKIIFDWFVKFSWF